MSDESEIGDMFGEIEPAYHWGLKSGLWGPPGAGKTTFIGTFPCSKKYPHFILLGDAAAANVTLGGLFWPRIKDGSIRVFDPFRIKGKSLLKDVKGSKTVNLEEMAYLIEDGIKNLSGLKEGVVSIDNITTYVKGISSHMERKYDTGTKQGKRPQFEWGRIYARISTAIFELFHEPRLNVNLCAQVKKRFDGATQKTEDGFSNLEEYDARWAQEIEHYVSYKYEIRGFMDFKRSEIETYVLGLPTEGRLTNILSFKKARLWTVDYKYDRFYNATYPNLKKFMDKMGVFYAEPPGDIYVPSIKRKGKNKIFVNTYKGDDAYEIPEEYLIVPEAVEKNIKAAEEKQREATAKPETKKVKKPATKRSRRPSNQ